MTKLSKKVMSLVLATSVAATSVFAGGFTTKAASGTHKVTIHFKKPSSWFESGKKDDGDALVYAYYEENGKKISVCDGKEYPGVTMKKDKSSSAADAGWTYSEVTVPDNCELKVAFSCSGKRTSESQNESKTITYAKGSTFHRYPVSQDMTGDKKITTEDESLSGEFSYSIDYTIRDLFYDKDHNIQAKKTDGLHSATSVYPGTTHTPVTASPGSVTATPVTTPTSTPEGETTDYNRNINYCKVKYKAPSGWKNCVMHFTRAGVDETNGSKSWRYQTMQRIGDYYYLTIKLDGAASAEVQFLTVTGNYTDDALTAHDKEYQRTFDAPSGGNGYHYTVTPGTYQITYGGGTPKQLATATATPVEYSTATPTPTFAVPQNTVLATVEPLKGPYVSSSFGSKATFADGANDDALAMILTLENGATYATYNVDNGPTYAITQKNTLISIGAGKIVGEPINLNLTVTDGKTTNTQTFTYTKVANYSSENMQKVSLTAATPTPTPVAAGTYKINFKKPANWNVSGSKKVYLYSYYTDANDKAVELNGAWPGTQMNTTSGLGDGTWYTATIQNATPQTRYFVSYGVVNSYGKTPEEKYTNEAQVPVSSGIAGQHDGFLVTAGTYVVDGLQTTSTTSATEGLTAYFGTSVSSPILSNTSVALKAKANNAQGNVKYSYSIGVTPIACTNNGDAILDTTSFRTGDYIITCTVQDDKYRITMTKKIKIVNATGVAPLPVPTATIKPSTSPSATPIATATATATVAPTTTATVTPVASTTPTVAPTATSVVVTDPTEVPSNTITGTISYSAQNKRVGEAVTVTLNTANTVAGTSYTYEFIIDEKVVTTTLPKTSVKFTTAGTHQIKANIFANGTVVGTVASTYTVKPATIKVTSLKANKKSTIKVGTKVTVSAKATTTYGKVSYKFAVKKGSSVKTLKNYSTKKAITWKATKKGTYYVYVYVKNGKGQTSSKKLKFVVK